MRIRSITQIQCLSDFPKSWFLSLKPFYIVLVNLPGSPIQIHNLKLDKILTILFATLISEKLFVLQSSEKKRSQRNCRKLFSAF